jgi:hypothetical protein
MENSSVTGTMQILAEILEDDGIIESATVINGELKIQFTENYHDTTTILKCILHTDSLVPGNP